MTDLRLGDHCLKIGSGATPRGGKDAYLDHGPYALIRSQNVHNDAFRREGLAFISQAQADLLRNVEVRQGDVLLNITGDSVARVCQVDPAVLPARVNQHVAIIRPDPERIDPAFLRYLLVTPRMQEMLLGLASAGATRNALTKGMIDGLPVPNIDIRVQRGIAQALSAVDDKIELNRRMNETLEAMAQAIFRDWFVDFGPVRHKLAGETDPVAIMGGLTPDPARAAELAALFPADLNADGLPDGWRTTTLREYANLNPESWSSRAAPASVQYVDLSNTKWGEIESVVPFKWAEAPSRARRVARRGDTLVGTVRPGNGSYAYVGIDGLTASTGFAQLRPKAAHLADLVYIAATNTENIERLSLLADGGAYPAVNPSMVLDTLIPAMPADVVFAFAEFASPIRALIEQRKSENRTLAETRDYLLPRLMSGAVRVGEAAELTNEVAA